MDPSYNNSFGTQPNLPSQPIISSGSGDIVLPSAPKKSKKPLIITLIIIFLSALLGLGTWWYLAQMRQPKTATQAFSSYYNLIQQDPININTINTEYQKYCSNLATLPADVQKNTTEYDQIYQFFYNYYKSARPSRADIAKKYLEDGHKDTIAYYQRDYQIFKDKTDEYSIPYYALRTEQLDILTRMFASYNEAGCLADFISGKGCASSVNMQISESEYARLSEIDRAVNSVIKLNQNDLVSGAQDIINLLEGNNA